MTGPPGNSLDSLLTSWLGTSLDFNVSLRELSPSAPVAPLPRKEARRPWDDLCGRQSLAIYLNPDSLHAFPFTLARLLGNTGEMAKQGLGTLNACQVGLTLTLS